jgi:gliding motility-associated-like protein
MKRLVNYIMNLICGGVLLISISTSVVAQVVVDCPQIPTYDFFQRDCFIKCEEPYGEIRLPQGSVDGLNSMRNLSISIPTNRPTWALAIAHSWNYNRNVIKKVNYPKISYWLAITGHEIGMTCDCGAEYIPGHIPWVDAVNSGGTTWPIECAATRNNKGDGCFQMEEGNGYGSLNQVYPDRFPCSNFEDMISNDNFETAALSMAYRNTYNHFLIDYSWGMDIWPLIENTVDKYAYERILATGWNSWAGGLHQNLTARYPAQFPYDLTTPAGRAAVLAEDFWDLAGDVGYYPDVIGWICAVLDSNVQAGTQYNGLPTIHSAHSTPAGTQSHVHLDNYNADISWQTVSDYLDTMFGFYHEFNTPALQAPIIANVQAVFVTKAGGLGGVIPFKNIGPVIDEIILNFPRENPLMTIIHDDGYPQGPAGNEMSKCIGNYAPASHIEKKGVTTDTICVGQSVILDAVIDGGDGPTLIYDWIVDGVATSVNSKEYVFTGSALGDHTFSVNVCNPQLGGCADACCEISVYVKQCTACTLSATSTSTNTPCENMWEGSIDLTVLGSASFTVDYEGPKDGSEAGTGGSHTISNLPDGVYNITLTDVTDPTCIFYVTETVGFVTAMNDKLTASIQTLNTCDAILQTEITQDKCECEWKVGFNTSYGAWGRSTTVFITTSGGGNLVLKGDVALNPSPDVVTDFNLCTGETIHAEISLRKASGGCTNGAVTTPEHPVTLWILDPSGTEVLRVTVPLSSISETANAFAFDYNVNCPYTPDPYTYSWNPGGLIGTPVNVSSTTTENVTYTVTATNTNNPQCTLSDTVMVPFTCTTNCTKPTSAISSTETSFCEGDSLQLTATLTGAQPWKIKVNNGTSIALHEGITTSPYTFFVSSAGTYSIDSVFDAAACPDVGDGSTVVVTMNSIIKPNLGADTSICFGDASVLFDAGGGYTNYTWTPGGASSQTLTSTWEGQYIVSVVDVNTCASADTINFNVDTIVALNLGSPAQICSGGTATLDAGSGYSNYLWNPGSEISQTISATTAGTYIVGVVDSNGCVDADTVEVTIGSLIVNLGNDTTICYQANLTLDAGPGFSSYVWTGGTTDSTLLINSSASGTVKYVVVVMDNTGCSATDSINVTVNNELTLNLGVDISICSGSASVLLDAGADYTSYTWSPGGEAGQTITATSEGTYMVSVEDINSCTAVDTINVNIDTILAVDLGSFVQICAGIDTTLDAGAGYSSYLWSPGAETSQTINVTTAGIYVVGVTDGNGCVDTDTVEVTVGSATVTLGNDTTLCYGEGLTLNAGAGFTNYAWTGGASDPTLLVDGSAAGTTEYSVAVIDNDGCTASDTIEVVVNNELTVDLGIDTVFICPGSNITINPVFQGGNGSYNFLWQDGSAGLNYSTNVEELVKLTIADGVFCSATDSVFVKENSSLVINVADATICPGDSVILNTGYDAVNYNIIWNTGENTQFITVKSNSVYGVVVDDGNGCGGSDSMQLSLHTSPSIVLGKDTNTCAGMLVLLDAGAGFSSYLWSDLSSLQSASQSISIGQGTYFVEGIDDGNGCDARDTVVVTEVALPNPNELTDTSACLGNSRTFTAAGFDNGSGPFSYLWQDNSTADSLTLNAVGPGNQQVWVEITDVYGCSGRDSAVLNVTNGLAVLMTSDAIVKLCEGASLSLQSNLTDVSTYNFNWTPGGQSTPSISVVAASTGSTEYILTVDDGTGCEGKDTTLVTNEVAVTVNLGADTIVCEGAVQTLDAGSNYDSYLWNTGESTQTINITETGVNWVKVTKSTSCPGTDTVLVSYIPSPSSMLDHDVELAEYCFEQDAAIKLNAGPVTVNQYLWSPSGSLLNEISVDTAGVYSVVISADNCTTTDSIEISTFCHPALYVPNSFTPNGDGLNDDFQVKGNVEGYHMNIFNRWGELLFTSNDINTSWDGNYKKHAVQIEVYVYHVTYQILDRKELLVNKSRVGTVTLIR